HLLSGQPRTSGRHYLAAIARDHRDQTAVRAIASLDHAHRRLPIVKAEAFHLKLRSVAGITTLLEDRLNLAREIGGFSSQGRGAGDEQWRRESNPGLFSNPSILISNAPSAPSFPACALRRCRHFRCRRLDSIGCSPRGTGFSLCEGFSAAFFSLRLTP